MEVCCVAALRYGDSDERIIKRLGNSPVYCDFLLNEQSKYVGKKSLKCKSFILLMSIIVCTGWSCFFRNDSKINKEANQLIRQSKDLQNLEKICSQLPILGRLTPVRKFVGKNENSLSYYYSLSQDFNQFKAIYKESLLPDGWTLTKEESGVWDEQIEFEKETLRIHIAYGNFGNENYALHCEYKSLAR